MLEEIASGKTVIETKASDNTMEAVRARVAAVEAKGLEAVFNESANAINDAPGIDVQTQINVPQPPEPEPSVAETKQSNLQKFKNADGTLNLDKVEKSNEHLKRGIESREEKLLKLNRELQKKFTVTSQELSAKSNEIPDVASLVFTDEGKKKILEDMEKDPIEAIMKMARTVARDETSRIAKDIAPIRDQIRESANSKELDVLVSEGHDWLLDENARNSMFDNLFLARPELRPFISNSRTPYRDALRFMEIPRSGDGQPTQAHVGSKTPIISASQAISPPSSSPPSTPERELANLNAELKKSLKDHDRKRAQEIEAQLDRVYKGMYR